jgi:hypothetical protein
MYLLSLITSSSLIHDGSEHNTLQSEAGYIDARPHIRARSTKPSCNARPDHTCGSFSSEAIGAGAKSMSAAPPIASEFCAPQRKTVSATPAVSSRSKRTNSLYSSRLGRGFALSKLASALLCRLSHHHERSPEAGIGLCVAPCRIDHRQHGLPQCLGMGELWVARACLHRNVQVGVYLPNSRNPPWHAIFCQTPKSATSSLDQSLARSMMCIPMMPISHSSGSRSVIPINPDQCGVA